MNFRAYKVNLQRLLEMILRIKQAVQGGGSGKASVVLIVNVGLFSVVSSHEELQHMGKQEAGPAH